MNVFIADDSILIRNVVEEILASNPSIHVVGKAANGADAVSKALALNPDIIIMDLDMPIMNGLEATTKIAEASSIPVLLFTHNTDPELPFRALRCGAADFLLKPDFSDLSRPEYVNMFIGRLTALAARSRGRVVPAASDGRRSAFPDPGARQPPGQALHRRDESSGKSGVAGESPSQLPSASFVVVGASTGGPQAVSKFLSGLASPFPLPIAIVQHIETGFDKGYADWLADETGHRVVLAKDGTVPEAGFVYVAPTDFHLKLTDKGLVLDDGVKVLNQKPSVDVLFASAAECLGPKVLAVLLTGMGTDGADGCGTILDRGGFTVVQDEATSLIFGMPRAAISRGVASLVLPLEQIAVFVSRVSERAP